MSVLVTPMGSVPAELVSTVVQINILMALQQFSSLCGFIDMLTELLCSALTPSAMLCQARCRATLYWKLNLPPLSHARPKPCLL